MGSINRKLLLPLLISLLLASCNNSDSRSVVSEISNDDPTGIQICYDYTDRNIRTASIYQIDVVCDEKYIDYADHGSREIQCHNNHYWNNRTADNSVVLMDAIYTQRLINYYLSIDSSPTLNDFNRLIFRTRSGDFECITTNEYCIDLINSLQEASISYSDVVLKYTTDYSNNNEHQEYFIFKQIDEIPIFIEDFQINEQIGLARWDNEDYWLGIWDYTGQGYPIMTFTDENNDRYRIDYLDYKKVSILENDMPIKSFEECSRLLLKDTVLLNHEYACVYFANLFYVPITSLDNGKIVLIPCWSFFYTACDDLYMGEKNGVVLINAITGENINIEDGNY